jgi:alkanesulfonate monooxygenase SsuD/methylene tetrahydromethanopterin reductase-like flavin-dependent oxidoreductase (luciferase family)
MDTQSPQPGLSGSASSRLAGASSNTSIVGTQHECRHQLVHWEAADAATKHMTQDAHFEIVRKTESSTNKKQHAVGCECLHTMVNGRQLTVQQTASVR